MDFLQRLYVKWGIDVGEFSACLNQFMCFYRDTELVVNSSILENQRDIKLNYLRTLFGRYHYNTYMHILDKKSKLVVENAWVVIDDWYEHIVQYPQETIRILIDKPYNRLCDPYYDPLITIDGWLEEECSFGELHIVRVKDVQYALEYLLDRHMQATYGW
jgi:hypothetical protein